MSVKRLQRNGRPAHEVRCDACGWRHLTLSSTPATARESVAARGWRRVGRNDVCPLHRAA